MHTISSHTVPRCAGVLNLVTGDSKAIGDEMLENETVRKIGFTGSTAVGKHLLAGAAATVKRVSMELGGNAPLIVFSDCDLELAADGVVASGLRNAGQTCICANRILIEVLSNDLYLPVAGGGHPLVNDEPVVTLSCAVAVARLRRSCSTLGGRGVAYQPSGWHHAINPASP